MRLEPGRAVLEERVDLYNASDVRHRYYWWTNAAVQAWEDSQLVYPTELMATHGFTSVEPWPIDRHGRDLSVIRKQIDGPVSLFTYETREGFVGVYHPHTNSGTVHVARPAELPVHKVWSWGNDREAATGARRCRTTTAVRGAAGRAVSQPGDVRLPRAAGDRAIFRVPGCRFAISAGSTRRERRGGAAHGSDRGQPARRLALDVTRDFPGARVIVRNWPDVSTER